MLKLKQTAGQKNNFIGEKKRAGNLHLNSKELLGGHYFFTYFKLS